MYFWCYPKKFKCCYSDWIAFIILSSRLFMHSSVSHRLLFIASRVFFISIIMFSVIFPVYTFWFLIKILIVFILSPNSFSILITNVLNSLSGKLFISVALVPYVFLKREFGSTFRHMWGMREEVITLWCKTKWTIRGWKHTESHFYVWEGVKTLAWTLPI